MARVLFVVPPFHQVFIPAIGVSLLKAALARIDIECDILYLNIRMAERIGAELYTDIASAGRFRALSGEWVFSGDLFGDGATDPQPFVDDVLLGEFSDVYDAPFAERLTELRREATTFMDEVMEQVPWD